MVGKHLDAAVPHFQQAIQLNSQAWVPYEGLARCTAAHDKWEEAISWQEKSIAVVSPKIHFMTGYLWPRVSEWAYKIGDLEKARAAAAKGFEVAPNILIAQTRIIYALHEQRKSKELVSVLEQLNSFNLEGKRTYSWLVRFFVESEGVYGEIGWACRKQGKPKLVIDALDESLKVVEQGSLEWFKVWLPYTIAYFKHTYYEMDKEAMELWEKFLELNSQQSQEVQDAYVAERTTATNTLAKLYFDAAVSEWKPDSDGKDVNARKLKSLAVAVSTSFQDDYEGFDLYRRNYPAMLWGRWLRDYRKADEMLWRKCFRTRLLEEMNALDDEDPTNDTEGLRSLAVSLFHAGDRTNAAAILAVLFIQFETPPNGKLDRQTSSEVGSTSAEKPPNTVNEEAEPDSSAISATGSTSTPSQVDDSDHLMLNIDEISGLYACEGCGGKAPEVEEIYVCELCGIFNWCNKCLVLLKDPEQRQTLPYHICNPKHDFYRAWPISKEAKYVAVHDFDHGAVVRKAWLEELRRQWWG
jgi:tetratricopeptide (TPR) repeat protein